MNRKRKADETYVEYHESQNREAQRIKDSLKGKYIHVSKQYTAEGLPMRGVTRRGSFNDE